MIQKAESAFLALDLILSACFVLFVAGRIARGRRPAAPVGRLRRWSVFALVNLGAACVLVDLAAVVAALAAPPRNPFTTTAEFRSGDYLFVADSELGVVHRPNFSTTLRLAATTVVHHDSIGARVDEADDETPSRVDLVTVGCSQAWGQGVLGRETFTSTIGRMRNWKVANLAISSHGGVGSLLQLHRHLDLIPEVVCYAFWQDHYERNLNRYAATGAPVGLEMPVVRQGGDGQPMLRLPGPYYERNLELTRRYFAETAQGEAVGQGFRTDLEWTVRKNEWRILTALIAVRSSPWLTTTEAKETAAAYVLRRMQEECESIGARLVVLYIPRYFDCPVPDAPDSLHWTCEELGIHLVDLGRRFRAMRCAGIAVELLGDRHMSAAAHQAAAEELSAALGSTD